MTLDLSLDRKSSSSRADLNPAELPLRFVLLAEAPLLFLVGLYCLIVATILLAMGREASGIVLLYNETLFTLLLAFTVAFVLGYCLYVMVFVRPKKLTSYIIGDFRARYLRSDRLVRGGITIAALLPFISAFTLFKSSISQINPFSWDATFAELDWLLHGGRHPWEWLHPLLGTPFVTSALNHAYHTWFFVLFAVVFHQAFQCKDLLLRMRFFITFLLLWAVIGSAAAVLFSSAGPVYYEKLLGESDAYGALFNYLYEADKQFPVLALQVQENLWETYQNGGIEQGAGISAMPSMHLAMATLFVLLARHYGKLAYGAAAIFLVTIFLGSVHLGWHYAVDGYVAAFMTWLIWRLVGRYLETFWRPRFR